MDSTPNRPLPQVAHLLIPEPARNRLSKSFFHESLKTTNLLSQLALDVVNNGFPQYYHIGGLSTRFGEDYLEYYQVAAGDNEYAPLWSNRVYLTGTIVRRSVIWQSRLHGCWTIPWFTTELEATMHYGALALERFNLTDIEQVRVLSVIRGAEGIPLSVPTPLRMEMNVQPREMDHLTVVPRRSGPLSVLPGELRERSKEISAEMGRIVRSLYASGPAY